MATPSQIRANRANAQRSSGPRSEAGREITKMNALKHGLAAKELIIEDEDPAALDALRADLIAEHQPVGQTESLLVEDLAVCWWRLQRARKYETGALKASFATNHPFVLTVMERLLRYTAAAERGWNRAQANLRTAQNDRRKRETSNTKSAPAPQPQETEKVMAIGSVLQNDPEHPETPASEPQVAPEPHKTATATRRQPDCPTAAPALFEMARQAHRQMLRESGLADRAARPDPEKTARGESEQAGAE